MPPKGWKKNAQPAVTGAKPEPQEKPEKAKAKRAVAKSPVHAKPAELMEKISSQYGTPGGAEVAYSPTIGDKMRLLHTSLAVLTQTANTQNLAAEAYAAINEEIEATVDTLGWLREELVPMTKIAAEPPELVIPQPEEAAQPKPLPQTRAAPAVQAPPPPPMPFPAPAPGLQQGPLPSFVPVAR